MKNKAKSAKASANPPGVSTQSIRFGWWALLFYLTLGIVLEALHGFKVGWYLDVSNETRRLMLTLAHAHGTLLSLISIAAGCTGKFVDGFTLQPKAAFALRLAGLILPLGFLLGGLSIHDGDPGIGIFLVPVGGLFLLYGVALVAIDLKRSA